MTEDKLDRFYSYRTKMINILNRSLNESADIDYMYLSKQDIKNILTELNIEWRDLNDAQFATTDWIKLKKLIKWDWTSTLQFLKYARDCDNMSAILSARFSEIYNINSIRRVYVKNVGTGSYHKLNLVATYDDGRFEIYAVEPQNDYYKKLKDKTFKLGSKTYEVKYVDFE